MVRERGASAAGLWTLAGRAAWPLGRAQQGDRVRRIGVLMGAAAHRGAEAAGGLPALTDTAPIRMRSAHPLHHDLRFADIAG